MKQNHDTPTNFRDTAQATSREVGYGSDPLTIEAIRQLPNSLTDDQLLQYLKWQSADRYRDSYQYFILAAKSAEDKIDSEPMAVAQYYQQLANFVVSNGTLTVKIREGQPATIDRCRQQRADGASVCLSSTDQWTGRTHLAQ